MEKIEAKFIYKKELDDGTKSFGFTFLSESKDDDLYEKASTQTFSFNLVTAYEDLEVLWSIEVERLSEYVKWKKIILVKCNKSIYGNFVIKGSNFCDNEFAVGNFDTNFLPYEQNFEVDITDSFLKITIFIYEPKNENKLSDDYECLLKNQEFSDIVFVIGNEEIRAHKQILAARNDVFLKMFDTEMLEKTNGRVEITDIESEIFKLLLKFIYCGKFDVKDTDEVLKVLVAANKYSVSSLIKICEESLFNTLSIDNVIYILRIADLVNTEVLKIKCINFVLENKNNVVVTKGYKEMIKAGRADLLSEIFCRSEVVKPVEKSFAASEQSDESTEESFEDFY